MCRKHLILIFAAFLTIALVGCGVKQLLPSKKVPPMEGYTTVLILPFSPGKASADYENLPTLISYAIGTKLKVRHADRTWIYDQSKEVNPVSDKLKELNISAKDVFEDPLTATNLFEAFQVDLIIAGQLSTPKFTREDSGKIKYVMDKMTPSGAARYYTVHQTATLPSTIKVIAAKGNEVIWDGMIIGYKKYDTDYLTGSSKKFQREDVMLADVRKSLVSGLVDKLYPK